MIQFVHPEALWLALLAVLPLIRRPNPSFRYSHLRLLPFDRLSWALVRLERVLASVIVLVLVLALSQPYLPARAYSRWVHAAVTVIVVDQSGSMTTSLHGYGGAKSRLDRALDAVEELVRRYPEDALGLVGFGDGALIYALPDTDHRMLRQALRGRHADMGGTIIDAALFRALQAMGDMGMPGGRAVVLVSDGEGRVAWVQELAQRFRQTGTYLYWVQVAGTGSLTATEQLRTLLVELGPWGQTFSADDAELEALFDRLARLHRAPVELAYHRKPLALFRLLLMVGLGVLLVMGLFVFDRRWA